MKGIGYFHPEWFHGNYHGALRVAREDFVIDGLDPLKPENAHAQFLSNITLTDPEGGQEKIVGVFEQAILGSYKPLGVKSASDITRWDGRE